MNPTGTTTTTTNTSNTSNRRLMAEFKQLCQGFCDSTVVLENDGDMSKWLILMQGPSDTPYEGGIFFIQYKFYWAHA